MKQTNKLTCFSLISKYKTMIQLGYITYCPKLQQEFHTKPTDLSKSLSVFANSLYRTDGKHKMACTSFQNYHNFPNEKVILYIKPDMLFPSIKPNKIFLMLSNIFLFPDAPSRHKILGQ